MKRELGNSTMMDTPYTNTFDVLVALITHLGATDRASRTPTYVAADLGFEKADVLTVLERFPAFFRRSTGTSKRDRSRGDHFYTLHLRYSRRTSDNEEDGASQPLSTEEINMLVALVAQMVEQEQENSRAFQDLQQSYKSLEASNRITMIAAIVAAIGAVAAAFVGG